MLEIDVTLTGKSSTTTPFARQLIAFIKTHIKGEAHLVVSTTDGVPGSNSCEIEHCGKIGAE